MMSNDMIYNDNIVSIICFCCPFFRFGKQKQCCSTGFTILDLYGINVVKTLLPSCREVTFHNLETCHPLKGRLKNGNSWIDGLTKTPTQQKPIESW